MPSPRAVQSAHDCRATPHCSSPPPLVIESPKASTPRRTRLPAVRLLLARRLRRVLLALLVGHLADDQRSVLDLFLDVLELFLTRLLLALPLGAHCGMAPLIARASAKVTRRPLSASHSLSRTVRNAVRSVSVGTVLKTS